MKPAILFAVLVWGAIWTCGAASDREDRVRTPGAEDLRRVDEALFPDSCTMGIVLTDFRPKTRNRGFDIEVATVRGFGSILSIASPATETGKRYLFKDRSIWMSLPGLSNLVRISAKEGFMDSNFSNSDLMDTAYSDDYDVTTERDGERLVLNCRARTPQVTYGSIRMTVDPATHIPETFEYFTRSGVVLKTCAFSETKTMGGRLRATRFEMRDPAVSTSYSVISIRSMTVRTLPASSSRSTRFEGDAACSPEPSTVLPRPFWSSVARRRCARSRQFRAARNG